MSVTSAAIQRYNKILQNKASNFSEELRKKRHQHWIEAANHSLNETLSAKEICYNWSLVADEIITEAWQHCDLVDHDICLLALGKWGALELNLSSDIDFFVISGSPISQEIQKKFNSFLKLINENSSFGFCFRTDINIRPGGRFGPAINSVAQAENYYWNNGATWEKVALVRARKVCGNETVSELFLENCNQFIYRKYLDYTLFEDLKSLRKKIHDSIKLDKETNIKLDPGGIRDIELFINALQVIHGGRLPTLRVTSTAKAIELLKENHLLDHTQLDLLNENYWYFRDLENKIQAEEDQQKHTLKADSIPELNNKMLETHNVISSLIGFKESIYDIDINDEKQAQQWLFSLGFSEHSVKKVWPKIIELTSMSLKTERDDSARTGFLIEFIEALGKRNQEKDLALGLLKEFMKSARVKSTFFTTLLRDPSLIKDLAFIFSSSAFIGNYIAVRPELIDSIVLQSNSIDKSDFEQFLIQLAENKQLTQISIVISFLKEGNTDKLCIENSNLADQTCLELMNMIKQQQNIKSTIDIIALGKWGGQELGLNSDLDFILVTEDEPLTSDFKVARRFLSRLTEQQKSGKLYSYDLRLRPSGASGPLLVSYSNLTNYLNTKAKAWERESFLKARPLNNKDKKLENLFKYYIQNGISETEEIELNDILSKLLKSKSTSSNLNLKNNYGGLIHTELYLQKMILKSKINISGPALKHFINDLIKNNPSMADEFQKVKDNYNYLRFIEQLYQVKSSHTGSDLNINSESFKSVCNELGQSPDQLYKKLIECLEKNERSLKNLQITRNTNNL